MTVAAQENPLPAFHLLVIPATFWGHMRPLFHLILNLLKLHPHIRATILLSPATSDRMIKDLNAFTNSEKKLQSRGGTGSISEHLQVVTCGKDSTVVYDAAAAQKDIEDYSTVLPGFIKEIFSGERDLGYGRNNRFASMIPTKIIMDMCQFTVPDILRKAVSEVDQPMPPVLVFCPISFSAMYSMFVTNGLQGMYGRVLRNIDRDVAAGIPVKDAYAKRSFDFPGEVVKFIDIPYKYDYELEPHWALQEIPVESLMAFFPIYHTMFDPIVSGFIMPFTGEFEAETIKVIEKEMGKPLFSVGPQVPADMWNNTLQREIASDDDRKALTFLDDMETVHGPKSVCYLSFGSLYFPHRRPDIIRWMLQTLQEAGIPVLFALSLGPQSRPPRFPRRIQRLQGLLPCHFRASMAGIEPCRNRLFHYPLW